MRSLLGLIRLCQARVHFFNIQAKLRFSNEVSRSDVIDCLEIIDESQKSGHQRGDQKRVGDIGGNIFAIIKSICSMNRKTMAA